MTKKRLWFILGAIALSLIISLFIFSPTQTQSQAGSSYNRAPEGYGAWYTWMMQENIPIQRWQKPLKDLNSDSPVTLIQVYSNPISTVPTDWVNKGNTLIILGFFEQSTGANFSTLQPTPLGDVKIDTRRRSRQSPENIILGDQYGAIIWRQSLGKGKIIYATTPYLAANAYQDYLSNYRLLAEIANQDNQPIWFDEYIHGYRDSQLILQEVGNSLYSYFTSTSLFPIFWQLILLFLLLVWAGFRPLGIPQTLEKDKQNNSLTYIQALASVLEKANKTDYVVAIIGKHQEKLLQKALLLENKPLDKNIVIDAWLKQTGKNPVQLKKWLSIQSTQQHLTKRELLTWFEQGQDILHNLDIDNPLPKSEGILKKST